VGQLHIRTAAQKRFAGARTQQGQGVARHLQAQLVYIHTAQQTSAIAFEQFNWGLDKHSLALWRALSGGVRQEQS